MAGTHDDNGPAPLDALVDLWARRGWHQARPWLLALPFADRLPDVLRAAASAWLQRSQDALEDDPSITLDPAEVRRDFLADDYRAACERWIEDATLIPAPFRGESPAARALRQEVQAFVQAIRRQHGGDSPPEPPEPLEEAVDDAGEVRLRLDRANQRLHVDEECLDLAAAPERWADVVRLWDARRVDQGGGWLRTRDGWTSSRLREFAERFGGHADSIWEREHGRVRLRCRPR